MTLDEIQEGIFQTMFCCIKYGLTGIPCCDCPIKEYCDAYEKLLLEENKNEESN